MLDMKAWTCSRSRDGCCIAAGSRHEAATHERIMDRLLETYIERRSTRPSIRVRSALKYPGMR